MYRLTVHLENVQKVDVVVGKKKNDKGNPQKIPKSVKITSWGALESHVPKQEIRKNFKIPRQR